jgi:hypothetical protein
MPHSFADLAHILQAIAALVFIKRNLDDWWKK